MSAQKMAEKSQASAKSTLLYTVLPEDLQISVEKMPRSRAAFSTWVRSLAQNWRQGTVSCKGRSDVARSTKKPWKQKGTGRARAGSARSPLWRGGGVTFGPQRRIKTLTIPRKAKKIAVRGILLDYLSKGRIARLDWTLDSDKPKTAAAAKLLKSAKLNGKKLTIFLPKTDALSYASFVNIPKTRVLFFDQGNAIDLTKSDYWVFLKKDSDQFKEMVARWI